MTRADLQWRLVAAAALLLLAVIGAALVVGAWTQRPSLVVITPSAAPTTPTYSSPSIPLPTAEVVSFIPPAPACPAPATEIKLPDVEVSVGGSVGLVATRGSSTATTCSTTGTDDAVPPIPGSVVAASGRDQLELSIPPGWAFLHIEGTDVPVDGRPRTDRKPIDRPDRPALLKIPAPVLAGDSQVNLQLWMVGEGGRVVGSIEVAFLVRVLPEPGSSDPPTATAATYLLLPPAAVRTSAKEPPTSLTAAYGPEAFEVVLSPKRRTGGALQMHDLAAGVDRTLGTIADTHAVSAMTASADRVTWVETWRDNPSPPTQDVPGCVDAGKPLRWQIVSLTLSTGRRATVESGTNRRTAYTGQCADVDAPLIAADRDRIAFTLEAGDATHPFGERLEVRSFATGAEIRSVTTEGMIEDLHLSGDAVAYRENTDGSTGTLIYGDGRLAVLWGDATAPEVLYDHAGSIALGGQRIAWVRADSTVDSIWTSTRGATEPTEVAAPLDGRLFLMRMDRLAVTDDLVAWVETANVLTNPGAGDCCAEVLAVWAPGAPAARYVEGFGASRVVTISGGWLAVLTDPVPMIGQDRPAGFHAVPVADVRP
ncbi:MAG: hypothetical protein ABJC39_07625 [Chloroflexota bacterium]